MKEIDFKVRQMYAFLSGYYQGVCIKKISDMYLMSNEELLDLCDRIRIEIKEKLDKNE